MIDLLQNIDAEILLTINGWHSAFADFFMKAASGKMIWVPLYVAVFYTFMRKYGWKKAVALAIMIGIIITVVDQTCASVIRPYFQRMRPSNAENPLSAMVHLVNGYRGGSYGFPSCHAANTFALTVAVFLITRNKLITCIMIAWAALNCYSRMYLGVHYPGDILVGAITGSAIAFVIYSLYVFIAAKISSVSCCEVRKGMIQTHRTAPMPIGIVFALSVLGLFIYATVMVL